MACTELSYPTRIIDKHELKKLVPFSSTHIARLEKRAEFPRRVQFGRNRVGWIYSEVTDWIAARMAERTA